MLSTFHGAGDISTVDGLTNLAMAFAIVTWCRYEAMAEKFSGQLS